MLKNVCGFHSIADSGNLFGVACPIVQFALPWFKEPNQQTSTNFFIDVFPSISSFILLGLPMNFLVSLQNQDLGTKHGTWPPDVLRPTRGLVVRVGRSHPKGMGGDQARNSLSAPGASLGPWRIHVWKTFKTRISWKKTNKIKNQWGCASSETMYSVFFYSCSVLHTIPLKSWTPHLALAFFSAEKHASALSAPSKWRASLKSLPLWS